MHSPKLQGKAVQCALGKGAIVEFSQKSRFLKIFDNLLPYWRCNQDLSLKYLLLLDCTRMRAVYIQVDHLISQLFQLFSVIQLQHFIYD